MELSNATGQWLPRHFVESAAEEGERFVEAFGQARFLLVDLSLSSHRLLGGLSSSCPPPTECSDDQPTERMSNTVTRLQEGPQSELENAALRLLELAGARAGFVMALDHRVDSVNREQICFGRHSDCDVVLKHASVSKHHAIVSKTPGGALLVYDTESKNGTWINGDRIRRATHLRAGDRVRFGDVGAVVCTAEVLRRALALDEQRAVAV